MVKVVAINGSLQKLSAHKAILNLIQQSKAFEFQIIDISEFPLFNEDIEKDPPKAVKTAIEKVRAADAIIFATPENNGVTSAPLKNAYDWLSRGGESSCLTKKLAGLVSTGGKGGIGSQKHFRTQVAVWCKLQIMQKPELLIPRFTPGFWDEHVQLVNEDAKKQIAAWSVAFADWVKSKKGK